MPKNGPRIDGQILCRSGPITTVHFEHSIDVSTLEVLLRFGERHDPGRHGVRGEVEVFRLYLRPLCKHDRFLQSILKLTDVARPSVLADDSIALADKPVIRRSYSLAKLHEVFGE